MTEQEIITLALYIASIRGDTPVLAAQLEQLLYNAIVTRFSEPEINYVLELTELRVYQWTAAISVLFLFAINT